MEGSCRWLLRNLLRAICVLTGPLCLVRSSDFKTLVKFEDLRLPARMSNCATSLEFQALSGSFTASSISSSRR